MAEAVRSSPLAGFAGPQRDIPGAEPVTLRALPFTGNLLLRACADAHAHVAAVLGSELPGAMRSAAGAAGSVFWLGPDEWLLVIAPGTVGTTVARLREGLAGLHHAVVEVSDRFVGIEIAGARAADVLNAGCPLDLHPRAFPAGTVTRTLLAKAAIVLHRRERSDAFELHVNGSFAPYAWLFLENAAREFGFAVAA